VELTVWTYEGPPHVGAMRVATAMEDVHYVLHAPQGDTYADLLFTMIERRDHRPPVTYTTFQSRDLGGSTADLLMEAVLEANERFAPNALLVGESCTAEIIQDNPGGLAGSMDLDVPVIPLELPAYQRKENWGASETFYQVVRALAGPEAPEPGWERPPLPADRRPRCNLLGPCALGFRHRDDVTEVTRLLDRLGVDVHVTAPLGARVEEIRRLGEADFNVLLYPEIGGQAARWLERTFDQPTVETVPIGVGATRDFVDEVAELVGTDPGEARATVDSRLPWWSKSVDSHYFTGKRVFIFGDATHAAAAARIASEEIGFEVVGLGCYNREYARSVRKAADELGLEALITDDYLEVEAAIRDAAPELVLGTQMERHIAKRLGTFCAVISAPTHVQDFPARYSPQMGPEGANVIFDTWIHPLVMGLEEHLLGLFQDDFEFGNDRTPSHLAAEIGGVGDGPAPGPAAGNGSGGTANGTGTVAGDGAAPAEDAPSAGGDSGGTGDGDAPKGPPRWTEEAEEELSKIPFFVRGKARRNTEAFAREHGLRSITLDTLYEAKAHFGS